MYDTLIQKIEKHLFEIVLATCSGKQVATAKTLGINRNTLRKKLTDYGLDPLQLRIGD